MITGNEQNYQLMPKKCSKLCFWIYSPDDLTQIGVCGYNDETTANTERTVCLGGECAFNLRMSEAEMREEMGKYSTRIRIHNANIAHSILLLMLKEREEARRGAVHIVIGGERK